MSETARRSRTTIAMLTIVLATNGCRANETREPSPEPPPTERHASDANARTKTEPHRTSRSQRSGKDTALDAVVDLLLSAASERIQRMAGNNRANRLRAVAELIAKGDAKRAREIEETLKRCAASAPRGDADQADQKAMAQILVCAIRKETKTKQPPPPPPPPKARGSDNQPIDTRRVTVRTRDGARVKTQRLSALDAQTLRMMAKTHDIEAAVSATSEHGRQELAR